MTNKEIDKIFDMLNQKKLEELKKYLLTEKKRNTSVLRQKTFEKYLTTNIWGLNDKTIPRIFIGEDVQIFTNVASIYIINKNFLNFDSNNLTEEKNKKRTTAHRYKLISKNEMDAIVKKVENMLGYYNFDILAMECGCELINKCYDVEYLDKLYQKRMTDKFRKSEIDTADILLDNPKYTIYNQTPILKAESEIGKAYIMGCKRT